MFQVGSAPDLKERARESSLLLCSSLLVSLLVSSSTAPVLLDLPHEFVEALFHVHSALGGSLQERSSKGFGEVLSLLCTHLSLVFKIALVTADDDWNSVFVLHSHYLLPEGVHLLKGRARCDCINKKEALSCSHVLVSHCAVLLLSCSVENIQ